MSGSNLDENEMVQLPEQMCINDKTIESLINTVYPGITVLFKSIQLEGKQGTGWPNFYLQPISR